MAVTITPEAIDLMRRSIELAKLDPAVAGIRLRLVGDDVMPRFAESPSAGDEIVAGDGVRVFVDRRVLDLAPDVVIAVSDEHERLVVRPA